MLASRISITHPSFFLPNKSGKIFSWPNSLKRLPNYTPEFINAKESRPSKSNDNVTSQREFMSAIIHELKTPLNAIMGFSAILREEVHNPNSVKECDEYAKEIIEAADDLNILIHDLLDVGSQVSGNFSIDLSKFVDIKNIIKRSIKLNYSYATRGNIVIQHEIAADVSVIKLDEKRTKQILTNLISNAAKYSSSGTTIKVVAQNLSENNRNFLQIIIVDQGFGMTKDQIETAFQKYKTIPNPNSEKVDSFGMGLPIVKQLVELQNGIIEISSEVGVGTAVNLKFPYRI